MIDACPMYVCNAFGFAPAPIIMLANVCRHSWSVIGRNPAAFHARFARSLTVDGSNGSRSVRPKTRSLRAAGSSSAASSSRSTPAIGTVRLPALDWGGGAPG